MPKPYQIFFSVLLLTSLPVVTPAALDFVVETSVFVDPIGVKRWELLTGEGDKSDIETEIQSMMFEVNEVFKSLDTDYGLKIKIQMKELVFLKQDVTSASLDGHVQALEALDLFVNYLKVYDPDRKYDLALLLTGNILHAGGGLVVTHGIANMGEICGKKSAAVVTLKPTYQKILVTAHEIAHVLGARHDSDKNDCKSDDEYIMNYSELLTMNRYKFSDCSYRSIYSNVTSLEDNCLIDHKDEQVPSVIPRFGSLMTADSLCKRHFGSLSYLSRKDSGSYGDDVCLKLGCVKITNKKKGTKKTIFVPTPDGLYCGKNKQCIKGKCVVTSNGLPEVSDTCPFGDQPVIEGIYPKACGQVPSKDCPKWKDVCCNTCDKHNNPEYARTADEACRDLVGGNSQMLRAYNKNVTYQDMCGRLWCLKGKEMEGNNFVKEKFVAPDGVACGKNKRCENGKCVVTDDGNPAIKDSCPFGDQPWFAGSYQESCDDIIWRNGCKKWGRYCCETCQV